MNQSKLEVITCSWRKAREVMTQLVLVLILIGWKSGANLLSQSRSVVNAKPITFRHLNENRSNETTKQQVCLGIKIMVSSDSKLTVQWLHCFMLVKRFSAYWPWFQSWVFHFVWQSPLGLSATLSFESYPVPNTSKSKLLSIIYFYRSEQSVIKSQKGRIKRVSILAWFAINHFNLG